MSETTCTGALTVMLSCADVGKSLRFYRDVLGFELKESWPDPETPRWASLELHGQRVMIGEAMTPESVEAMCGEGESSELELWRGLARDFRDNKHGVGIQVYVQVPDVDAFHDQVIARGAEVLRGPKTQFYGLRDFALTDPDGYLLIVHTPVAMESCQSCGMPLADAEPGEMYCRYCVDELGRLKPYDTVFEGTVTGYFMGMQKMERAAAEQAAREHLAKMPAWAHRS